MSIGAVLFLAMQVVSIGGWSNGSLPENTLEFPSGTKCAVVTNGVLCDSGSFRSGDLKTDGGWKNNDNTTLLSRGTVCKPHGNKMWCHMPERVTQKVKP
jgi:hypothetical protein